MLFTTTAIRVCFASLTLTLYMQITVHSTDFADKNVVFDFSDACLFGHPVHFDYHDFLSFTSDLAWDQAVGEKVKKWGQIRKTTANEASQGVAWGGKKITSRLTLLADFFFTLTNFSLFPQCGAWS